MDTLIAVSILIGVCLLAVGWIWSMIVASKVHLGWVLGMLVVGLIIVPWFALTHWDKAKRPFIVWGIGIIVSFGSILYSRMLTGK
jgi:hypothetical protein